MDKEIEIKEIEIKSPYEIKRIISLEIINEVNEHGKLKYEAVIDAEKKDEYVEKSKYTDKIEVIQKDKEGEYVRTLFSGEPTSIEVRVSNGYYFLVIEALSYTYNMDIEEKNCSYQDENMTYKELVKSVIKPYNKSDCIMMVGENEGIETFKLKYGESDWKFLKRVSSMIGGVLVSESRQEGAKFWFGLPKGETYEIESKRFKMLKKANSYRRTKENYREEINELDYAMFEIIKNKYMFIGDKVVLNEINTIVGKSIIEIKNGVLIMKYTLMQEKGMAQNLIVNDKIKGLSIEGKVLDREANKIKIKLDIDNTNEDCGERWFKYESGYVSGGSDGWYMMPEKDHFVSLHMPTEEEKYAYSTTSVRRDGKTHAKTQQPSSKILGTEHNKELRMEDEKLKITAKDDKTGQMYIQMEDENGVTIQSDKDIVMKGKKDINVFGKTIKIKSDTGIYLKNKEGMTVLDGEVNFYNTKIDIGLTSEGEIEEMKAKKGSIIKGLEGFNGLGTYSIEKGESEGCGDPVNVVTGNYYIEQVDMIIKGKTPLNFVRFYNSLDDYRGVMGESWIVNSK
jgi:hypothetical protein